MRSDSSPTTESAQEPAWERLKPKDQVLVVGSSWAISWDRDERKAYINKIRELIEDKLGLTAVIPEALMDEPFDDSYVNDAKHRAEMDMLATKNSDIKMIWNLHGGFGALESGKLFDEWRKENPDVLKNGIPEIGFSDATVKILRKGQSYSLGDKNVSGIVSPIHGPTLLHMVSPPEGKVSPEKQASFDNYIQNFKELFLEGCSKEGIKVSNERDDGYFNLVPMNDAAKNARGVINGEALGGHTSRITTSFGTEWEVGKNHTGSGDDKVILTIEADDVTELKRFLDHARNTALWPKISAIAIGCIVPLTSRFTKSKNDFYDPIVKQEMIDVVAKYDKPVFGELSIGHTLNNAFLPMLTPSQIIVGEDGKKAQLKVHTFRSKGSIEKVAPAFDPNPNKRFAFSRKELLKSAVGQKISLVKGIKLIPITQAAKKTDAIRHIDIVGGDIGEEQVNMGTPQQLEVAGKVMFLHTDMRHPDKILMLAGDDTSPPHFSSLVKANIVRFFAHMNETGMFKDAQAIIIGDIIPPSGTARKSKEYLKNFNKEIKIFLEENNITLPVYRAVGHQFLPERFHMSNVEINRTGIDNLSSLSSETLIEKNKDKPKVTNSYLGAA